MRQSQQFIRGVALAAEQEESGKLRRLVSAILPLEQWETGFEMMRKGEVVKILIDMDMERKS